MREDRRVFMLGRPSPARLDAALAGLAGTPLTYAEVGATERAATDPSVALPDGYHHARLVGRVGQGDAAWAAAAAGIRAWQLHRGQGIAVLPDEPPVAVGTEVLGVVPLPVPPVHVLIACRVLYVVDEPDRFGFGYGTLELHPESGEESFVATRAADGTVDLHVTAFSRGRHPLVRLGGPVTRLLQARAARGYVAALRAHVAASVGRDGPGDVV